MTAKQFGTIQYNDKVVRQFALMTVVWGVVGMFLCVPIMVVLMIVLAHFETTRPVAVLLSADGDIPQTSL